MERPIIDIDDEKCNGCGKCILDCAEGALAIVDGKARLISEVYCDGLGACLNCPQDALSLKMREAPAFDEAAALAAKKSREGSGKKNAPLSILQPLAPTGASPENAGLQSRLRSWPIQLALAPPKASFFTGANLLLAAHCSGFALPDIGENWLAGKIPLIACPKLEDNKMLLQKLTAILAANQIASLCALRMSVPCCSGLTRIAEEAIAAQDYAIPLESHIVRL